MYMGIPPLYDPSFFLLCWSKEEAKEANILPVLLYFGLCEVMNYIHASVVAEVAFLCSCVLREMNVTCVPG